MSPADVSILLLENERLAKGNIDLNRYNKILKDQLSQLQDHIQEIRNAKDRLEKRLVECGEFLSKYGICFLETPFVNFLPQSLKHLQIFFPVSLKMLFVVVSFRLISEQNENPSAVLWDGHHTSPDVTSCPLRDRAGHMQNKTVRQRKVIW